MYLIKIIFSRVNNTRHMLLKHIQRIGETPKTILFSKFNFMAYKIIQIAITSKSSNQIIICGRSCYPHNLCTSTSQHTKFEQNPKTICTWSITQIEPHSSYQGLPEQNKRIPSPFHASSKCGFHSVQKNPRF